MLLTLKKKNLMIVFRTRAVLREKTQIGSKTFGE